MWSFDGKKKDISHKINACILICHSLWWGYVFFEKPFKPKCGS
jgi:hypothetical protein